MVQKNLHLAIDSFVRGDAEQATAVIKADVEIDRLNASLFAQLIAHVAADPATVTRVLPLTSVCRYLERIGDHVKNLAEEVIFMVQATDVATSPRRPHELDRRKVTFRAIDTRSSVGRHDQSRRVWNDDQ